MARPNGVSKSPALSRSRALALSRCGSSDSTTTATPESSSPEAFTMWEVLELPSSAAPKKLARRKAMFAAVPTRLAALPPCCISLRRPGNLTACSNIQVRRWRQHCVCAQANACTSFSPGPGLAPSAWA
eukprot:CAMPEP_0170569702 /NCGR_PEP_ID=MMETSP0224-20130122/703_1 /TAXON_ID=285029 /ORGANISM="Togula jolla, Strain CCCM 725" /LENGTH=128 /DNA_ID=CAMNT_0010891901 /DNA_START=138 /DNA_END=524 /DNA_ORIENTATION=-